MSPSIIDLPEAELREGLAVCLHVPRWVDDVAGRAPYSSLAELEEIARAAATPLAPEEVDQALSTHPRIGEKASGESAAAELSKAEQSSSASSDPALDEALANGNRAYEETVRADLPDPRGRSLPARDPGRAEPPTHARSGHRAGRGGGGAPRHRAAPHPAGVQHAIAERGVPLAPSAVTRL